jgi:hypothetical protein
VVNTNFREVVGKAVIEAAEDSRRKLKLSQEGNTVEGLKDQRKVLEGERLESSIAAQVNLNIAPSSKDRDLSPKTRPSNDTQDLANDTLFDKMHNCWQDIAAWRALVCQDIGFALTGCQAFQPFLGLPKNPVLLRS